MYSRLSINNCKFTWIPRPLWLLNWQLLGWFGFDHQYILLLDSILIFFKLFQDLFGVLYSDLGARRLMLLHVCFLGHIHVVICYQLLLIQFLIFLRTLSVFWFILAVHLTDGLLVKLLGEHSSRRLFTWRINVAYVIVACGAITFSSCGFLNINHLLFLYLVLVHVHLRLLLLHQLIFKLRYIFVKVNLR